MPADRESLEALPGVGRKTANVVLNTAFGHPTIAVDTHIFRVANRLGLARGTTVEEVERKLHEGDPARRTCKMRTIGCCCTAATSARRDRPECWRCLVIDLCSYKPKSLPPPARSSAGFNLDIRRITADV